MPIRSCVSQIMKYGRFIGIAEFITSANSTIDSNGFLKAALPILRLFASDDVKPDDGFIKAGFVHVNDKAKNAYAKKIASVIMKYTEV